MNLTERLRGVIGTAETPRTPGTVGTPGTPGTSGTLSDVADLLGGDWRDWQGHRYLVVDRQYAPGYRHGRVAVADAAPEAGGWWPALGLLAPACAGGPVLFLDLETTGLSGGAGTYAFLIGCGWFEPASPAASASQASSFRVRQLLLTGYAAEPGLLAAIGETAGGAGAVATYNGKSFDLPVLDTRCVLHRLSTPFDGLPHVDMLHPARRLWRDEEECRLSVLEQTQCGHRREGDVPGFEIPSRYFHFVRSGDARGLAAVMEHNRLDLLSLALLTARAAQLLDDGPAAAKTAREALGIGRVYERAGLLSDACAAFDRAATMVGADLATRAEALRAMALVSRRQRRFEQAAGAWRQLLALPRCPERYLREATEALAVHHEHRLRDPRSARSFALQAMQAEGRASRREALEYRLARLNRKLEEAESAALF